MWYIFSSISLIIWYYVIFSNEIFVEIFFINHSSHIVFIQAKALDGDYCTKDEPSLLVRIEFLNVQDVACVMTDYPTLDFERFQLYHTR